MVKPFRDNLRKRGLSLARDRCVTLQINTGFFCNQTCAHCHLSAGPARTEMMNRTTMEQAAAYALRAGFEVVDITGGAPELNPDLPHLIGLLHEAGIPRIMVRANLTALADPERKGLAGFMAEHRVVIVASFPSLSPGQSKAQRGDGVFDLSLAMLGKLNKLGYGEPESGLELNLVVNPAGAFLPGSQESLEKRFRAELKRRHGVCFNNLFAFANAPLGRFKNWLNHSGNYNHYMKKLEDQFNPCALTGLMCRSLVSMDWRGYLYDCDFNLAADLPLAGRRTHVSEMTGPPREHSPIALGDHCYTCTAGAGFT